MSWWYFLLLIFINSALTLESRVYSGVDLQYEEQKHLVKLKITVRRNLSGQCSGSILTSRWVISSAHCFHGGENQIGIFHQSALGQRIIAKVDPANINLHPQWIPGNKTMANRAFDLVLLKTARLIKFSDHVQPVKLTSYFPRNGDIGVMAGFGESEPNLEPPRQGSVVIHACFYQVSGLLCSTEYVRAGSGDSGGPLVSNERLVGVTSASCRDVREMKRCTTVYVNVVAHLPWILEVIK